jgi:hypothetical protein
LIEDKGFTGPKTGGGIFGAIEGVGLIEGCFLSSEIGCSKLGTIEGAIEGVDLFEVGRMLNSK